MELTRILLQYRFTYVRCKTVKNFIVTEIPSISHTLIYTSSFTIIMSYTERKWCIRNVIFEYVFFRKLFNFHLSFAHLVIAHLTEFNKNITNIGFS